MGLKKTLSNKYMARTSKLKIMAGPFKGMAYVGEAFCSVLAPKLAGTYELELVPAFEELIANAPEVIFDIGAADGYYAIGLARALPNARIIAYEAEEQARSLLKDLSAKNGVAERIEIKGLCEPAHLQKELEAHPDAPIIMDVEGAEDFLLDPEQVPALKTISMVIVEIHSEELGKLIEERFRATHSIEVLRQMPRTSSDFPRKEIPSSKLIGSGFLKQCLNERRGDTYWFVLRNK